MGDAGNRRAGSDRPATSTAERELAAYLAQNGPEGLLRRYARGRVRYFFTRQWLTVGGSLTLAFLVAPWVGFAAALIALLGEAIDCGLLVGVPSLLQRGMPFTTVRRLTTASAAVQAVTIAGCVVLAWFAAPDRTAVFMAMAYLAGAAINAGLVLPYHKSAAIARLAVYAATLVGLFGVDALGHGGGIDRHFLLNALAAAMLAYTTSLFIGHVARGHAQSRRDAIALLSGQRDLAQANAALEARQRDLRQLSLVAETAQDGIVICDRDLSPVWANRAFADLTGHDFAVIRDRGLLCTLSGPETGGDVVGTVAQAVAAGRSHRGETVIHDAAAQPIWVDLQVVPTVDADGVPEVVIAILRDITAAKAHSSALAASTRAAEASERAKTQFLATMSHEIRTPLNGILGMSEVMGDEDLSEGARETLRTIRTSAEALLKIVNDILDLSRLEAGEVVLAEHAFDPAALISDACDILRPQARSKGLDLRLDFGPDLPPLVLGDDGRLRQIVLNMVANAVKFTARGSVCVTARHAETDAGIALTVSVRDTGMGVAPEAAAMIFERFRQADAALTRQHGGTGLGLSIARSLARRMGGDLWLDRSVTDGACFVLRVALSHADPAVIARQTPDAPLPPVLSGLRILVADDNRVNRLVIEKFLAHLPVELHFVENGAEAVDHAARSQPDLIFMDVSMPVMDGLTATRAIRGASGPQPKIVALTANAFGQDRETCLAAGMDDFLSKPVSRSDLFGAIARAAPG